MFNASIDYLISNNAAVSLISLLIKTLWVLLVFLAVDLALRGKIASSSRSILLLMAYVSVLLQPLSWIFSAVLDKSLVVPSVVSFTFERIGGSVQTESSHNVFVLLYLIPVLVLGHRLMLALIKLRSIKRTYKSMDNPAVISLLHNAKDRLKITRSVQLSVHSQVSSPMSFGLLKPQIVLPVQAQNWSPTMIEHVLLHELVHIKRYDWVRVLLAYCVTSLIWANPLAWVLLAKTRACAEDTCDEAVVNLEGNGENYAQNLVGVARLCQAASLNAVSLSQSMLQHSSLKLRVHQILGAKIMKTKTLQSQCIKVALFSCLLSAVLLLGLSGSQTVTAQTREPENTSATRIKEFIPLHTVVPYYPTQAAADGIEGWVQVRFNVGTKGEVIPSSIEVVDAEPANIFDASAKAAVAQFQFTEYAPEGFAVIVPDVQYVFRYSMSDDN